MIEKLKTGVWFLQRPEFWAHARELAVRKVLPNHDTAQHSADAEKWASERVVPVAEALRIGGLQPNEGEVPRLPAGIFNEARERASQSTIAMGGPGDLDLLYAATVLSGAVRAVETGVAYGWSSLAILAALQGRTGAKLISIDMPYPKLGNESFVGIAVPDRLRDNWELIREPDRHGLQKAITKHGGTIDLCHYDSDKSYRGRRFAYPILWNALRLDGVFISDDIQDNFAFKEFVEERDLRFAVTAYQGKFVGILRKA